MVYTYIRIRYDAASRLETREYSSTPDFAKLMLARATLYDASGHAVASSGLDSHGWRDDQTYDSEGNQTRWGRTYTNALDLTVAAQPPFESFAEASHTYDSAGRLATSTVTTSYSGSTSTFEYTYTTDDAGRCAFVTSAPATGTGTSTTLKFTYLPEGGILNEQTSTVTTASATVVTAYTTELKVDSQGRWRAVEQDGGSGWGGNTDGTPDIIRTYSYADDGTIAVTYLDYLNDTPNDEIMRDGKLVMVTRSDFVIAPQCATVAAALPKLTGNACRYPMPSWADRMTF